MKQTAVEWLRKQIILNSKLKETKTGKISFTIGLSMLDKVIEQAKEMEKEQIIEAFEHIDFNLDDGLHYYTKTYESNSRI